MSTIHTVSPTILAQWLADDEAVLVDVREVIEYQAESIKNARNLPLSEITVDAAHLPKHRHKKLVIQCRSGKRSMMACETLKNDNAPFDVWNLEGGILAWKDANLPTQFLQTKRLPIDRQVQVALGIFILTGLIFGFFFSTNWLLLPIIVGLGLINAGLTGWCGLAKMMMKMPWNKIKP